MRTKQPKGSLVTLVKIIDPFTEEIQYLTYRGDERKTHTKRGETFLFEVQNSGWQIVVEDGKIENNNTKAEKDLDLNLIKSKGVWFPQELTEKDRELILEQCKNQGETSREKIEAFALAYSFAKVLTPDAKERSEIKEDSVLFEYDYWKEITPEKLLADIFYLATMIELRNQNGYRKIPVTFRDGSTALPPEQIEHAMKNFIEAYVQNRITPAEVYEEFERIHPFEDGNGRVGDLLWKMAVTRNTDKWPQELPPDIFAQKNQQPQFLSMAEKRRYEYLREKYA